MTPGPDNLRTNLDAKYLKTELRYEIAEARSEGEPVKDIARRLGVSASFVSKRAIEGAWMVERRNNRPLPQGLTTRAAIAIEDELGIWPTDDDKDLVEREAARIFQSENGRRAIMAEIGTWLLYHQRGMLTNNR